MTIILIVWFICSYVLFVAFDYFKEVVKDCMSLAKKNTSQSITKRRIINAYRKGNSFERVMAVVWAPALFLELLLAALLTPFTGEKRLLIVKSDDERLIVFPEIDLILYMSTFYNDYIPFSKQDFFNSYIGETDEESKKFVKEAYKSLTPMQVIR